MFVKDSDMQKCLTVFALICSLSCFASVRSRAAEVISYYGYTNAIELKNEKVRVVLCPEVGGRVVEYSHQGVNVLFLSEEEKNWKPGARPQVSAGRFDIGPELVVPKRDILWSGKWEGEIVGERSARLTSQIDPNTGVQLIRDFELDAAYSHLVCTQTILNRSQEMTYWCHWSRTFVVGKGLCWIPVTRPSKYPNQFVLYEEGTVINMKPDDPVIHKRAVGGEEWLQIGPTPRRPKLGFDSMAGAILYASPNDLLFVKRFETFPERVYNEAAGITISVWYPDNAMVELEPIGPRESLKPGMQASFTEHWYLTAMPFPGLEGEVPEAELQKALKLFTDE